MRTTRPIHLCLTDWRTVWEEGHSAFSAVSPEKRELKFSQGKLLKTPPLGWSRKGARDWNQHLQFVTEELNVSH